MAISDNKYIAVAYKLYAIEDGEKEMIEEATIDRPFQFISEMGTTLPAFENGVKNLAKGEEFSLTLNKEEGYGEYNEEHVIELPKNIFEVDGHFDNEHIFAGNIVPLMDSEGRTLNGTVVEVKDEVVVMDMNHPLAGSEIQFEGFIIENRPATDDEIQGMINMITGAGEGCGCGSDSCGCDSSEDGDCGCGSGGCGCGC